MSQRKPPAHSQGEDFSKGAQMTRPQKDVKDFHIYLPASLASMVQDVADGNGRSASQQITVWIEDEIERLIGKKGKSNVTRR